MKKLQKNLKTIIVITMMLIIGLTAKGYDFVIDGIYYEKAKYSNTTNYYAILVKNQEYINGYKGNVIIPDTVEYNGDKMAVKVIDTYAFDNCKELISISIPRTVTIIYDNNFAGCKKLTKVILKDGKNKLKWQKTNAFKDCPLDSLYLGRHIYGDASYTIRDGVRKYFSAPFENSSIRELIIGSKVDTIEYSSFSYCKNLKKIVIPDNVKYIDEDAFSNCQSIESIIIGNSVSSLENFVFGACKNLTNVYIGNNINSIKDKVFMNCDKLTNIYLFSDILTVCGDLAIPTTVSRIYVPNTQRYENLFKDYYTENLIILDELEMEYIGQVPKFNFKNNVDGMDVSFDVNSIQIDAGKYSREITVYFSNNEWSSSIEVPCKYTITKAPLTVIANDAERQYGDENPDFTCTYFGFKNNENENVLIKKPTISTMATKESKAGMYDIIPTNAEAKNYTLSYERGTLTINKADQSIVWEQVFDKAKVGEQIELLAKASSALDIKYSVSDESIAEIYTSNGKKYIDCLKEGEVVIKANQSGNENYNEADRVTKHLVITKNIILANFISINTTNLSLNKEDNFQLSVIISPENTTNKNVVWTSSDDVVATVDKNGLVTAIAVGEAIITATTIDSSNLSATCKVTVMPTLAESITLDKTEISLEAMQTATLVATILPELATNKAATWTSSDKAVATVDENGLVTAIAVGEAIITATTNDGSNLSASCKVSVVPTLAESIVLDKTAISLKANESAMLVATVLPESTTDKSVMWTSLNESVATVDANGLVTAIAVGEAIITATTNDGSNLSASCKVTVIPTLVTSIEVTPTEYEGVEGSEFQLTAIILPEEATNKVVIWSSSDEAIANVSEGGLVKVLKEGNTVITASTTDGSNLTATCKITVLTSIDGVSDDNIIVVTSGDYIIVSNAPKNVDINVYSNNGTLIRSVKSVGETISVNILSKGIYYVKVGNKTVKVII